jgi:FtsP/CotA-like multicopper oxidase with cupredoxin domain
VSPEPMNTSRREFLVRSTSAALAAGAATRLSAARSATTLTRGEQERPLEPAVPGRHYRPVVTPNGVTLPHKVVGGVKVFHLIAEEVEHEFAPGMRASCWGYNGRVHGPTIEAVEGDRVRIYVTNRLDVPTSVHWHGFLIPNGMDGVAGLTQRMILPGETFKYEFALRQHGTFMYHSHHDEMTQMAMGLMGLFVVHPRHPEETPPDRDYAYLLSEWSLPVGARRPDPNEMTDFNVLTFNAVIAPATAPIVARTGERVRIRIGNLSAMDHHPIHVHGHAFTVTETDGGVIPPAGRWPEVSVLVPVGSTRTVELVADNPGDWALHCHMTHHVMTQMGHGIPNLIGVDPSRFDERLAEIVPEFEGMGMAAHGEPDDSVPPNSLPMVSSRGPFGYITMSGMFTVLQVRDELGPNGEAGPYVHPAGTLADVASAEDLREDGIDP